MEAAIPLTWIAAAWQRAPAVHHATTAATTVLIEQAIREHESLLRGLATRLTANPSDADDLVQDTFVRALANAHRCPADSNLRAWLVTILKNRFIDLCRRRKRAPVTASLDPEVEVAAPQVDIPPRWTAITAEQVTAACDRLPEEFRVAYKLKELDKQSYSQIAATLGIPEATVGTRILRARRKLKQILEEMMQ